MSPLPASATATRARTWVDFALAFVCVFGGLSLPLPGLARVYVRVHAALGGLLLPEALASRVKLAFITTPELARAYPWSLVLQALPRAPQAAVSVPIDLRTLVYLPSACFVALAVATPLASRRQNLKLLGVGLSLLTPLLVGLVTLPVLSFFGGTGPVRAFELGVATHTVLQVLYRALVASPSMAYVLPLLLWWALLNRLRFPKSELPFRISKAVAQVPPA